MDTLKALLKIILLTTYLLKGGIDASGGKLEKKKIIGHVC